MTDNILGYNPMQFILYQQTHWTGKLDSYTYAPSNNLTMHFTLPVYKGDSPTNYSIDMVNCYDHYYIFTPTLILNRRRLRCTPISKIGIKIPPYFHQYLHYYQAG